MKRDKYVNILQLFDMQYFVFLDTVGRHKRSNHCSEDTKFAKYIMVISVLLYYPVLCLVLLKNTDQLKTPKNC